MRTPGYCAKACLVTSKTRTWNRFHCLNKLTTQIAPIGFHVSQSHKTPAGHLHHSTQRMMVLMHPATLLGLFTLMLHPWPAAMKRLQLTSRAR